jgi:hypothetical protein
LGVQLFNRAVANNVGYERKPEFEYGGHQTGNTNISAPLEHRNVIPMATPKLSGYSILIELWKAITLDLIGSYKFNMAAAKQEVIIS